MGHRLPAGEPGRSVARQRHDCAEAAFVVKALMDAAPGGEAMPAGLFEAAACCDAALAGLLTGDLREAARVLKALYVAGRWPVICWVVGVAGPPLPNLPRGPLLDDAQMTALRERAGVLAASPLPESWVGDELLDLWQPGCPLCRAQPGVSTR